MTDTAQCPEQHPITRSRCTHHDGHPHQNHQAHDTSSWPNRGSRNPVVKRTGVGGVIRRRQMRRMGRA